MLKRRIDGQVDTESGARLIDAFCISKPLKAAWIDLFASFIYHDCAMSRLKEPKATIKIPRPLYNRLKTIIAESGFDSVTDFVVYVLRDIAAVAVETDDNRHLSDADQIQLSGEEVRKVRERLKRLGYL